MVIHRTNPFIRHALMRANLQAGHTTSSAAGDDSGRHRTAIVRNVCIIGFSGLEHFERPFIRCGFHQDRPSLRVSSTSATAEYQAARFVTNKQPWLVHNPAAPLTKSKKRALQKWRVLIL